MKGSKRTSEGGSLGWREAVRRHQGEIGAELEGLACVRVREGLTRRGSPINPVGGLLLGLRICGRALRVVAGLRVSCFPRTRVWRLVPVGESAAAWLPSRWLVSGPRDVLQGWWIADLLPLGAEVRRLVAVRETVAGTLFTRRRNRLRNTQRGLGARRAPRGGHREEGHVQDGRSVCV